MEPLKPLFPFATWVLRVAVLILLYVLFFKVLRIGNFNNTNFLIALGFGFCGALLFIGGFLKKSTLTIIASALLIIGCAYYLVLFFGKDLNVPIALYAVLGSIALFFLTNGNRIK